MKTHCKNNHKLNKDNVFYNSKGYPECRICSDDAIKEDCVTEDEITKAYEWWQMQLEEPAQQEIVVKLYRETQK